MQHAYIYVRVLFVANMNNQMLMPLKEWNIAVCTAARRGKKEIVTTMLTDRGARISDVSIEGRGILLFAVQSGKSNLVEVLLTFQCDPNQMGPFGELPICMAAKAGFDGVLEVLAKGGADLNKKDGRLMSCLDYLQKRGDRGVLLLRLQEASGLVACRLGCGMVMKLEDLQAHESSTCERTSVSCPYCFKIFTVSDFVDQHDCRDEPFQCKLCNEWTTVGKLSEHEVECMKTVQYVCEECTELVYVKDRLTHNKYGCMERVVECANECGASFQAKYRVMHCLNDCSKRVVDCPQCKEGFEHWQLAKHVSTTCPARSMVCRFGCDNIPLIDLHQHELNHLNKDLLLWTPHELLYWLELHENFNNDIQLKFRVLRIFCDDHFYQDVNGKTKKKKKNTQKKINVKGEIGGSISGKLLSSLFREKLYNLLLQAHISRPFSKNLVEKIGNQLRSTCPRECGAQFLLKDRKEHADFCPNGIATCVRCGSKMMRKDIKNHKLKECTSMHSVRWWPKAEKTKNIKCSGGSSSGRGITALLNSGSGSASVSSSIDENTHLTKLPEI
jgi:hypothetical protein